MSPTTGLRRDSSAKITLRLAITIVCDRVSSQFLMRMYRRKSPSRTRIESECQTLHSPARDGVIRKLFNPFQTILPVTDRLCVSTFENDPFFSTFPRQNFPENFHRQLQGFGQGMIIDSQRHILTGYMPFPLPTPLSSLSPFAL